MVVYLPVSSPWEKSECSKPEFKEKTIILDEGTNPPYQQPMPNHYFIGKETLTLTYFYLNLSLFQFIPIRTIAIERFPPPPTTKGDYPNLFERPGPKEWLLYLKRSYVRRHNGEFKGYMGYLDNPNVLPMTYPGASYPTPDPIPTPDPFPDPIPDPNPHFPPIYILLQWPILTLTGVQP